MVCVPQIAVPTLTALSTGGAIPYPKHPPACHACTLWAEHTACAPPSPETTPHSTASEGFIGTCSQAELPCPWLGCTDPFLGTLPAPRAQTGQLQPSAARLCRSIRGSGMPGGLGVPIILPPFLAPGHPDRARQATACPLLSLSPQPGKHTYGAERVGASLELRVEDICKPAHTWSVRPSMCWSVVGVCKDARMCLGTCCAKGPRWVTLGAEHPQEAGRLPAYCHTAPVVGRGPAGACPERGSRQRLPRKGMLA